MINEELEQTLFDLRSQNLVDESEEAITSMCMLLQEQSNEFLMNLKNKDYFDITTFIDICCMTCLCDIRVLLIKLVDIQLDFNIQNEYGESPFLFLSLYCQDTEVFDYVLRNQNISFNFNYNGQKMNPLLVAVTSNNKVAIDYFIEQELFEFYDPTDELQTMLYKIAIGKPDESPLFQSFIDKVNNLLQQEQQEQKEHPERE